MIKFSIHFCLIFECRETVEFMKHFPNTFCVAFDDFLHQKFIKLGLGVWSPLDPVHDHNVDNDRRHCMRKIHFYIFYDVYSSPGGGAGLKCLNLPFFIFTHGPRI